MSEEEKRTRSPRPFPRHSLQESLKIAQAIHDKNNDRPMKPMFVAESIGRKPESSEFRLLLSSSLKYGLTKGSYVSDYIELTPLAIGIIKPVDELQRDLSLKDAAQKPEIFRTIYEYYRNGKFPTDEFFKNKLEVEFGVPREFVNECAQLLYENGKFVGIIRDVMGSPRVVFDAPPKEIEPSEESEEPLEDTTTPTIPPPSVKGKPEENISKKIFIAHGKNTTPLGQLKGILDEFKVPYIVAVNEANRGRPISAKVKEEMQKCSSAIFIFTADEETQDGQGMKSWRPSDNVVYELGAATYLYENRIIIMKEEGVSLASDFNDFGYITFQKDNLEAKAIPLIKELVALQFVKITPT
jgi:hypothetical protein